MTVRYIRCWTLLVVYCAAAVGAGHVCALDRDQALIGVDQGGGQKTPVHTGGKKKKNGPARYRGPTRCAFAVSPASGAWAYVNVKSKRISIGLDAKGRASLDLPQGRWLLRAGATDCSVMEKWLVASGKSKSYSLRLSVHPEVYRLKSVGRMTVHCEARGLPTPNVEVRVRRSWAQPREPVEGVVYAPYADTPFDPIVVCTDENGVADLGNLPSHSSYVYSFEVEPDRPTAGPQQTGNVQEYREWALEGAEKPEHAFEQCNRPTAVTLQLKRLKADLYITRPAGARVSLNGTALGDIPRTELLDPLKDGLKLELPLAWCADGLTLDLRDEDEHRVLVGRMPVAQLEAYGTNRPPEVTLRLQAIKEASVVGSVGVGMPADRVKTALGNWKKKRPTTVFDPDAKAEIVTGGETWDYSDEHGVEVGIRDEAVEFVRLTHAVGGSVAGISVGDEASKVEGTLGPADTDASVLRGLLYLGGKIRFVKSSIPVERSKPVVVEAIEIRCPLNPLNQ